MDSNQLLKLHQAIKVWPANESDALAVAEIIAAALDTSLTGISLASPKGNGEELSLRLVGSAQRAGTGSGLEALRGFFAKQLREAALAPESPESPGEVVRRIRLTELLPDFTVTIVAIEGEIQPSAPRRTLRVRKCFGHLIVGAPNGVSPEVETALVSIARRLAELAEMADFEGALQLRNQFLSIASHELKTPLTSIYGMLQLQERALRPHLITEATPVDVEKQRFYLRKVLRQVERLNELIDDLLDVSRIQNGRFVVEPSDTDVSTVLRDTISTRLDLIANEQGVKVHLEAPDQLMAWVDPVRLEEVITNLVMNAIRFSPEGGVVWVKLRKDGEAFRLMVRDQGPSLPIEDRERIFHPFERAQRTSRLGGLGLGLFISRQIAQLHGGNVSLVESVPGKGNVFEAHLPLAA